MPLDPPATAPQGGSTGALPTSARVVIIGGGCVGASIAYHLTRLGWSDVVLLERKRLTSGTTWHAAGLVGQLRATQNLTRLAQYTTGLYAGLEAETGQATGFQQRGSLSIATHAERLHELKRGASMARLFGLEVDVVGPDDIQRRWPLLNVSDVLGGVWLPKDGQTNPIDTTMALIKGATSRGARVFETVRVTGLTTARTGARPHITGVETDRGPIAAEYVVIAAGMWSRALARPIGVDLPLQACEHFYIVTESFPGLTPDLPVLRDPDACAYYKEDAGKLLLGAFEPNAKPWAVEGIPEDFEFGTLPEDMDHFQPILEAAMHRLPALSQVGIRTFFNGPESFTPDVRYLLGETPEVAGLFVACGFNSIGIQSAGGAGRVLAEWIVQGYAPMDLGDVDVRRMQPFQAIPGYLAERVRESLGLLYAMHWPHYQYQTARTVRTSPLHERLAAAGAVFGEVAGWERANWFAAPDSGVEATYRYSWFRQNWFPMAAQEHEAVRTAVGLFDMSSFGKIMVQGRDAEAVLERICANSVAVAPGRIVYTQWLNDRAGIEADLTVIRLDSDRFLVVTAAATLRRDLAWLIGHIPDDARATVTDVTSAWAVLSVMGPASRALLSAASGQPLSNQSHPFRRAQWLEVGHARVLAARITYVGELGWELYIPTEFARGVFDRLMALGPAHGLRLCGLHAMDCLRMEKAYRHWGDDIGDEDTPLEAALMGSVRLDKPAAFIGRDALMRQVQHGAQRRLLQFRLHDPEPLLFHDEPIWIDGRMVGRTTSGAYGHAVGAALALGYVAGTAAEIEAMVAAGGFAIEVAGERHAATASLEPFYDPSSSRIRA